MIEEVMDRVGAGLGALAGLVGISCCVLPTVLAAIGLSSVSFALSLGTTLYYGYGWYFRAAALAFAVLATLAVLQRRRACTLPGARGQLPLFVSVGVAMIVVYAVLYALTAWLARLAAT
jgi:hypothetical protein